MNAAIARMAVALYVGMAVVCAANVLSDPQRSAPLQVVGRCDSCSSRWEGGSIYSYCELSVLRLVRGAPQGDAVIVRQRGGTVDGLAQKVTGVLMLEPGGEYLLFLHPDDSGSWSPVAKGVRPVVETLELGQAVDGKPLDAVIRELGGAN